MNVPQIGSNFEISGYKSVQCSGNPDQDAQNFATANGISLSEAKKILSGQFGNPVKNSNNQNTSEKTKITVDSTDADAELADDVDFKPSGDPQEDVKKYAELRGISQDEAKAELEEKYGKPDVDKKEDNDQGNSSSGLFTGERGGKYYEDGILLNGKADNGKYYKNGKLLTGKADDGKYYKNGEILTGLSDDGKYYEKGKLATGTFDGVYYKNGVKSTKNTTSSSTTSSTTATTDQYATQRSSFNDSLNYWTTQFNTAYAHGDKNGLKYAQKMVLYYQSAIKNLDLARMTGRPIK